MFLDDDIKRIGRGWLESYDATDSLADVQILNITRLSEPAPAWKLRIPPSTKYTKYYF